MANFLQVVRPIDSIYSDTIFTILGFKINNSTLAISLIFVLLAVFCFFVIRNFTTRPGKLQVFVELLYGLIENFILQITASKRETRILLPFIGSLFLFIALSNLLGNVPGLTNITFAGKALFKTPTADFSTTFILALACILMIQIMSIKDFGLFGHIGKFVKVKEVYHGFKNGFTQGLLSIVDLFIGFLDIISEIARVISLSLRLFGNLYAGLVLATVISGMMAYVLPSFLVVMGLMFAVVQAVVFSSLVTVYYVLSVKIKPEDDL